MHFCTVCSWKVEHFVHGVTYLSCLARFLAGRLVYDRETGKPKGYGFCEYADQETAQSAMRNLNNHDFNGRPLRVGYAAGESSKDEMKGMQQAVGGMVLEVRAKSDGSLTSD